jgi:16S rRNA (cytosine967-C5)-methyltransferase
LVERVIATADRAHPADGVLREELKAQRGWPPEDSAAASRAVFGWYRWRSWLDEQAPMDAQIEHVGKLAAKFAAQPRSFSDAELTARVAPGWLAAEMDTTPGWARAIQAEPRLWLRAKCGQGKALAAKLGDCRPFGHGPFADALEYLGERDLFQSPEFWAGDFELQDISSQAVGVFCDARPGQTWWDACAGEGGKTLHLSGLMQNKGLLWASDRAGWRLQKLRRRAARAGVFNYRAALWDGGPKPPTKTKFDGVLVDAPCSGVGTWQRNPHARWTTTQDDVQELGALQKQILGNAAPSVKPGGKLVYAVCTLTRSETVAVADEFEGRFPDFERLPGRNPLAPDSPAARDVWLHPEQTGGGGMFMAAWVRRKTGTEAGAQ